MENLFELLPEKYWDFPSSYSKERKESEILTRIASDDYIASLKKMAIIIELLSQMEELQCKVELYQK